MSSSQFSNCQYLLSPFVVLCVTLILAGSFTRAAKNPPKPVPKQEIERRTSDPAISRVIEYSLPDEHYYIRTTGGARGMLQRPLYSPKILRNSTGLKVGDTYYEYQHNGSMHRQIGVGQGSDPFSFTIHFEWMFLASEQLISRNYAYAYYDAVAGVLSSPLDIQPDSEYAGYVSMDVTPDNRAIVSGHNDQGLGFQIHTYFQQAPNTPSFGPGTRIPREVTDVGNTHAGTSDGEVVWPAIAYQEPASGDPILHTIGLAFGGGGSDGSSFHYCRKEGVDAAGVWVQGWMDPDSSWRDIVDTIHNGEGYDLVASKTTGKVAIVWVDNRSDESCPGDTCFQDASTSENNRWDNDLYVQISDDYGVSWNPRMNITKNVGGADGWRPFADMSALITSDNVFHIAYVAMKWEEANQGLYASRIHHWSETLGFGYNNEDAWSGWPGNVRTVADANWDPPNCTPGAFQENQSRVSLSECNGRLYVLWTEFNTPHNSENWYQDDCAARAWNNQYSGAANGDLLISVSNDNLLGSSWGDSTYGYGLGIPRNLTDTYGGPSGDTTGAGACDPPGVPCASENWASMAQFGTDYPVPDEGNVITSIDPYYSGSYYLDIAYMMDPDPGGAIMGQGSWYSADYLWARVPCYEPESGPCLLFGWSYGTYSFPLYVKHCLEEVVDVLIENRCNTPGQYSLQVIEDPSPYVGWLNTQGFSGVVGPYPDEGQILINAGGLICEPGTVINVTGRVQFFVEGEDAPTYEVDLIVADTVIMVGHDTVTTTCLALSVGNNGNLGNQGQGGVNMDYEALDWKEGQDTYIYDGGTVVGHIENGTDTIVNWGLFQAGIADSVSLIPLGGEYKLTLGWAEQFNSGVYVTNDSSIALEADFFAPLDPDSCNIIIKRTKVYSRDGQPHASLMVGEVVDFDIPSDSNPSYNSSGDGFDPMFTETGAQLVFLQGVNFPWAPHDTAQFNNGGWDADERFGVLVYLGGYRATGAGETYYDFRFGPHGMYSASNISYVYPYSLGFDGGELYTNMSYGGYNISDSVQDLHVGCSYVFDYDLASDDTLYFYLAYITNLNAVYPYAAKASSGIAGSVEKAMDLYDSYFNWDCLGCCNEPGDANADGSVDIADLTYTIAFMWGGGPPPVCRAEGDFNNDGELNITDLTDRVAYMFYGGPPPYCSPCGR